MGLVYFRLLGLFQDLVNVLSSGFLVYSVLNGY